MLSNPKPHHCFVIDGAGGRNFAQASWANEFITTVQAMYRTSVHDKMAAKRAGATSGSVVQNQADAEQQQAPAVNVSNNVPTRPTTTGFVTPTAPKSGHPVVNGAVAKPATVITPGAAVVTSSTTEHAQEQSRKRHVPEPANASDRANKSARPQPTNGSIPSTSDGMSLYDRVKAMHDKRAKLPQGQQSQEKASKMSVENLVHRNQPEQSEDQRLQQRRELASRITEQLRQQSRNLMVSTKEQQLRKEGERAERLKQQQLKEEAERLKQQQLQEKHAAQLKQQQYEERQREQQLAQQRHKEKMLQEERERERQLQLQNEKRRQEENERQRRILAERRQQQAAQAQTTGQQYNPYVSQAQQELHAQSGFAAASMAPLTTRTQLQQSASPRFVRVPSPVTGGLHHAPQQSASPHAQQFRVEPPAVSSGSNLYPPPTHQGQPRGNGFEPIYNSGAQVYQNRPASPSPSFPHAKEGFRATSPSLQQQRQQSAAPNVAASASSPMAPAGEDDELRVMWVNDYDEINANVVKLEMELTKLTQEGHAFVHRYNNITIPDNLQLQINQLRAQRDQAIEDRFTSVVRVLIFSSAVRTFALQNEASNIWSDVPEVLKASHKKCAELASDIQEYQASLQKLRGTIEEAVSSGDPSKMQYVPQLGAQITDLEQKIHTANAERDKQFTFMFQFSQAVRNRVCDEWNGAAQQPAPTQQ